MSSPKIFLGSAFDPDLEGGRGSGRLTIDTGQLRFFPRVQDHETLGKEIQLPIAGLRMRLGGASDRLIFFEHSEHPGVSVFTSDQGILELPLFLGEGPLGDQAKLVRSKKRNSRAIALAIVALLLIVCAGLVILKDPLVTLAVAQVPPSEEVKLGEIAWGQIQASTAIVQDSEIEESLAALAGPLLQQVPDTGYSFELHLANEGQINAFALPGGHIIVNSGLILEADSAEEVLGVLAHDRHGTTPRGW